MTYILFEDESRMDLLPLTYTRPVSDLRVGIDTLAEKWARHLGTRPHIRASPALSALWPLGLEPESDALWLNAKRIPDPEFVRTARDMPPNGVLQCAESGDVWAFRSPAGALPVEAEVFLPSHLPTGGTIQQLAPYPEALVVRQPWDLFRLNGAALRKDFREITVGRRSEAILDKHTVVYGAEQVFVEPGAKFKGVMLDAEAGPIYIGPEADLQLGALVQGAHAFCRGAVVNMGAKLRGDSTIGPFCKVGGEVSNSVFWGYTNKSHDGFVGNSVLGAWCNLGADTNTSNLKNNYSAVRVFSHKLGSDVDTGLTFCGLLMADHAKCGINTMFNTGTVVGVAANVFGGGFPPKFVPSFAWGGPDSGFGQFRLDKAYDVASRVMARRNITLTEAEKQLLGNVFAETAPHRAGRAPA